MNKKTAKNNTVNIMSVTENINQIKIKLPTNVKLVAVSKFHPIEAILEAYRAGQRIFAESRVQELCEKQPTCPKDIDWHFIGHLQTNKIKLIVPFVSLIHGVDSLKLLKEINKEGEKIGRIIPCLLQIHIAQEETKFGLSFDECRDCLSTEILKELKFIHLRGLMGMATLTDDSTQIHAEFKSLKSFFMELKKDFFMDESSFCELSMGMSDDYNIAIEEGSTMVRIGSAIFGARVY
jgi:PLP dependent protein